MKVLITGGAGFIASHAADLFLKNGHEVVIVDDLSTGKGLNLPAEAKFYKCSIGGRELANVFVEHVFDAVCHHAAQINVRTSIEDPMLDARTNVMGSINLLEHCRKHGVKKIIYASSGGAIYGEPEYLPCDEKHPIRPISPYGVTKYVTELYLHYYEACYGMKHCALRYANVYGPRQDPAGEAGVISIFAGRLLDGRQCTINGDGEQTRDFVFVKDVARANLLALGLKKSSALNIGTGKETSVNVLYETIERSVNSGLKPVHGPAIAGEVQRIMLDNSKAKAVLGWEPRVSLQQGIHETIEWMKNGQDSR